MTMMTKQISLVLVFFKKRSFSMRMTSLFHPVKYVLFMFVLSIFSVSMTSIRADDQSSGCGLGWAVTKRKSILSSLVRAYTNVTFSSSFGMTSGTSGCAEHSLVMKDKKMIHYTESNYHQLMQEMAEGEGEFIRTYAHMMGCRGEGEQRFIQTLKKNYSQIYTHEGVRPDAVYEHVKQSVSSSPWWKTSCRPETV
jgi:hypothetical protein